MSAFRTVDSLPEEIVPGIPSESVRIFSVLDGIPGFDQAGFSANIVEFAPHTRSPATLHRRSSEMFYLLEGEATITIGEETRLCQPGAIVYFPPETVHIIETKAISVRFLAVKCPGVVPGGDIEFVEEGPPPS